MLGKLPDKAHPEGCQAARIWQCRGKKCRRSLANIPPLECCARKTKIGLNISRTWFIFFGNVYLEIRAIFRPTSPHFEAFWLVSQKVWWAQVWSGSSKVSRKPLSTEFTAMVAFFSSISSKLLFRLRRRCICSSKIKSSKAKRKAKKANTVKASKQDDEKVRALKNHKNPKNPRILSI